MPELTLDEKKVAAQALLAEVREADARGGSDDGEGYAAHVRKMQEAQTLMI